MTCTHCRAELPPGITLCPPATQDLKTLLNEIPSILEDAQDTIAKLDVLGKGSGGGADPAAGSAAPLNLEASTRARELRDAVHSWARTVLEDDTTPGLHGIPAITYLQLSVDPPHQDETPHGLRITQREDSGELLLDLSRLTSRVLNAIDLPPDLVLLGRCSNIIEDQMCPGRIIARADEHEARCRNCGATYDVQALQASQIAQAKGIEAPLSEVVRMLRKAKLMLNPKSVQRWAANGDLTATRHRADGVALYSPGNVLDTHQKMRQRKGGRPRSVA